MARRSRDEWREIYAQSERSELMNWVFADSINIKPGTLSYWRCKLRNERIGATEFVEVHAADHVGDGSIRVEVGNLRVTLTTLPPAAWLAQLASPH